MPQRHLLLSTRCRPRPQCYHYSTAFAIAFLRDRGGPSAIDSIGGQLISATDIFGLVFGLAGCQCFGACAQLTPVNGAAHGAARVTHLAGIPSSGVIRVVTSTYHSTSGLARVQIDFSSLESSATTLKRLTKAVLAQAAVYGA